MSASYNLTEHGYGELMACLIKQRHLYATEEEFKAFAVESVRRFIADLRGVGIEISMRPSYLETPASHYTAERFAD